MARGQGDSSINPLFGPRTATKMTSSVRHLPREPSANFIEVSEIESRYSNFKYDVDYDIEGSNNCSSSCDADGICRCYTIDSVNIESVNHKAIANTIFSRYLGQHAYKWDIAYPIFSTEPPLEISNLTIKDVENIVEQQNLECKDFVADVGGGYYGDELNSIFLEEHVLVTIDNQIKELLASRDASNPF